MQWSPIKARTLDVQVQRAITESEHAIDDLKRALAEAAESLERFKRRVEEFQDDVKMRSASPWR